MSGPLAGVRVVELAGIGPGPFGGMVLADFGADVIRIDRLSDRPPELPVEANPVVMARGKRSIALDLKEPADLEVALRLSDTSDVLIDPFRPGVIERLGIAPACLERNPRLVLARMTGWGQDGPLAGAAGHDINYIALAGALYPMGDPAGPPQVPLNLVGDFGGGGMLLVLGVVTALLERERSGQGQVVDVAMVDGIATLMTSIYQLAALGQWTNERGGNWLDGSAPWYGVYRTGDGRFLTVGALEEKFYAALLEQLDLDAAAWPQWDVPRWPALRGELEAIFAQHTLAEWQSLLEGTDVCFAPVLRPDEAARHPQLVARQTFMELDGVLQPAVAPRFSRTPAETRSPPPWPGEHSEEIRAELDAASAQLR